MLAPPSPMSTQAVTAKLTTIWQCRGQTVAYILSQTDQSFHICLRTHAYFLFTYIKTSGPFAAYVLAAQAKGSYPPASNNCDIWKEPLWFSSHLILVAFGQNPQVWLRTQVRLGAEREKRRKE